MAKYVRRPDDLPLRWHEVWDFTLNCENGLYYRKNLKKICQYGMLHLFAPEHIYRGELLRLWNNMYIALYKIRNSSYDPFPLLSEMDNRCKYGLDCYNIDYCKYCHW